MAEMEGQDNYKEWIDSILIQGKGYCDPTFSATRLAEMLGLSPFQLSRILKAEYGMSYSELVHLYRIHDAMRHLRNKRFAPYSIDDIGAMVGFNNRQSFFSAFKKVAGSTPEKFRQT
ncbi:MAG: AraC family transcriptional regulator [Bacteroidaceae bacterium]|nr:AraC family transcriptional regulator [Bacteroidaceae bacterium]